jgi:tetratricopeptide (TPR) repeat protein
MDAESAYLFRHALLRDAAYGLQMPRERGLLHALVLEIVEELLAGDSQARAPMAEELAMHARAAAEGQTQPAERERLLRAELAYVEQAMHWCAQRFLPQDGARHCLRLAEHELADVTQQLKGMRLAGDFLLQTGRASDALSQWQRALGLSRRAGIQAEEAQILGWLAIHAFETGDYTAADTRFREALEAQVATGNIELAARTRARLGNLCAAQRDFTQAEELFRQSLGQAQDPKHVGAVLGDLAMLYTQQQDYVRAETAFAEALRVLRESGNLRGEGIVLANLAILKRRTKRLQEACELYGRSLEILRAVSHRRSEALVHYNSAEALLELGRTEDALQAQTQAQQIFMEVGNPRWAAESASAIAAIQLLTGSEKCVASFVNAIELHRAQANKRSEAFAWCGLSEAYRRRGDMEEADRSARQAQVVGAGTPAEVESKLNEFRKLQRAGSDGAGLL